MKLNVFSTQFLFYMQCSFSYPLHYHYGLLNVARYKLKLLIEAVVTNSALSHRSCRAVFYPPVREEGGARQPHK